MNKEKFKIGDKIICKKDYDVHSSYGVGYMRFLEGFEYEVLKIGITYGFNTSIKIRYNSERCFEFVGDYTIYEHFITLKEYRKQKLEKIECTSLIDKEL